MINLCTSFGDNINHIAKDQGEIKNWVEDQPQRDRAFKNQLEQEISTVLLTNKNQIETHISQGFDTLTGEQGNLEEKLANTVASQQQAFRTIADELVKTQAHVGHME